MGAGMIVGLVAGSIVFLALISWGFHALMTGPTGLEHLVAPAPGPDIKLVAYNRYGQRV
jgi:hypothetical protein